MEERNFTCAGFISWMFLCLLSSATPLVPSRISCEILEHANITCYWSAVSSDHTNYTLLVNKTNCGTNSMSVGSCTTTKTRCSVAIGSLSHCFCVDVMVQSGSRSTRSPPHCFNGINAVKLYPPEIVTFAAVPGKPQCLNLKWIDQMSEYVPSESSFQNIQIEYRTLDQSDSRKITTSLHDWQKDLCGLHPGTRYSVRVRAQDTRAAQHWSSWSPGTQATTPEAAPTAAPELWRHIQPVSMNTQRLITLLWKPLRWPDTNGVILHYTASCWNDLDSGHWDSEDMNSSSTSCVFSVSDQPRTCNLTASNSAGTSPPASLYIPGEQDTVLPPLENISITPLDDFQLCVVWNTAKNQPEASFVVEWFPVPNNTALSLHWKILNGSTRNFIITDGLQPEVPYNVSVRVLHNQEAGAARFVIAFTRQGVPSVGPKLEVLQTANDRVTLKWRLLPLETLRGFIRNYTLLYQINGKMKSEVLDRNVEQFSLTDLSPGEYSICLRANTVAGGATGPCFTVAVWSDNTPVMTLVLCAVGSLLIVVMLLSKAVMIQQSLCPAIPDPRKSNLSFWPSGSSRQHTVLDSPLHVKPIFVERLSGADDYPHHTESQVWNFSKSLNLYTAVISNEPTLNTPDGEEMTEDLHTSTDWSYQNIPPDSPDPYVDVDIVETSLCNKTCQENDTFSISPLSRSRIRVDTLDSDHLQEKNTTSTLKPWSYTHVSTSRLPVTESYRDICTLDENVCYLLPKWSLSETHLSSSYQKTDLRKFIHKNSVTSSCYNYAQIRNPHSSPDVTIDDIYTSLCIQPDESPSQFPIQKDNTENFTDLLRS